MVDYFTYDPRFALDPNDESWALIIEKDAAARFEGRGSKTPYGEALYLWGRTAIFCARFGAWISVNSARKALKMLLDATAERDEFMPDGDLAFYVQVPAAERAVAQWELEVLFTGLSLRRTTLVLGNQSADFARLEVWRVMEW